MKNSHTTPLSKTSWFVAAIMGFSLLPQLGESQDATTDPISEPLSDPAPATTEPNQDLTETVVDSTPSAPAPATPPPPAPPAPAAPTPPPAPAPPAPEPAPVEPLVINDPLIPTEFSAFRTGTPLIDIPRSLSIFTEERIQDQAITSLGEIVDYTPGVNTSQGEGHRDAIVFRGQRSTADFFIDGIRDDVQYYRPLYNVEQVEILRGPGALHFGRGGTGGILNRVMKKPVLAEPSAKGYTHYDFTDLDFAVDSFGANISQFDLNRTLGASAGFRLNTYYEYVNNHRDFYDGSRVGVNPTFAIMLGPDTRLDFSYEFNDNERFIDRGIPTGSDGQPVTSLTNVVFGDSELNMANFRAHTARAMITHRFNDIWKGRVTAFHGDYDKTYTNFYATGYNQATDVVTMDGYLDSTYRRRTLFSGDLVGEFDTCDIGHRVVVGAEYINTSNDNDRFTDTWSNGNTFVASTFRMQGGTAINAAGAPTTASLSTLNDDTHATLDVYSFFFQDEISLNKHWAVILGGRYDSFDLVVDDLRNNRVQSRRDDGFSPRGGIIFKPVENVSIYGSYSETFLPQSGEQFASRGDDLEPDTFENLEAGINFDLKDDLRLRMAIFELTSSQPQPDDNDPSTLERIDTENTGFETELTGYLTSQWYLSTGYTYLTGEVIGRNGTGTGLRPRELPRHMFSIWNRYQVNDCFGLGLGLVYQDESFANNNNTAILPSYTRVDAAAYYKLSEKTRLQLNVENLFDKQYFPNAHSTHQITVGRPINATLSVKSSF